MMNYTPRGSADELFRSPSVAAGSNAEKLVNLRKVMKRRKRELRDTERIIRETARVSDQSCKTRRTVI
jgi:hypothetical protein